MGLCYKRHFLGTYIQNYVFDEVLSENHKNKHKAFVLGHFRKLLVALQPPMTKKGNLIFSNNWTFLQYLLQNMGFNKEE